MFHTRIALKLFKAAIGSGEWLPMACMPLLPPPTFFFEPCRSPLPQSGSVLLAEPFGTPELSRARVLLQQTPEPARHICNGLPSWHAAQLAADATFVSPFFRDGLPHRSADFQRGISLSHAKDGKPTRSSSSVHERASSHAPGCESWLGAKMERQRAAPASLLDLPAGPKPSAALAGARWLLAPEPSRLPPLLAEAFVLQLPCWHLP